MSVNLEDPKMDGYVPLDQFRRLDASSSSRKVREETELRPLRQSEIVSLISLRRATVLASDFGVAESVPDNKERFEAAFSYALQEGKALKIQKGRYRYSKLAIPDELVIESYGVTLARTGIITPQPWFFRAGKKTEIDDVTLEFDGTEIADSATATLFYADDDFTAGTVSMVSPEQLGNINGLITSGHRTWIETAAFENIDYGMMLRNMSTDQRGNDNYIGSIRMRNFLRYFYGIYAAGKIGDIRCAGRSSNAPVRIEGDQNNTGRYISGLWEGCSDFTTGDAFIEDGGHGGRIGGSPHANAEIRNLKFGKFFLTRARGDGFKIAPSRQIVAPDPANNILGVTEKAYDIEHAGVTSIDGGDGIPEGNRDFIRISHAVGVHFGPCFAPARENAFSHQTGVLLNDSENVRVESVEGTFNSAFVTISGTSDTIPNQVYGGPVKNVRIPQISGRMLGSNAIAVDNSFEFGDIHIGLDGISGHTRVFAAFNPGLLTDRFRIYGRVGGVVMPVYLSAPNTPLFEVEVEWSGLRAVGPAALVTHRSAFEVAGQGLDTGSAPAQGQMGGIFVTNRGGVPGDLKAGGTIAFGYPGSHLRGGAMGVLQFGAATNNTGLGFWTAGAASPQHTLALSMSLRSDGNLELPRVNKGIVLASANGKWLARITDAGAWQIVAAPVIV